MRVSDNHLTNEGQKEHNMEGADRKEDDGDGKKIDVRVCCIFYQFRLFLT